MAKVTYTKSDLQKQRSQLALYRRILPSLDLKRRQLTIELQRSRRTLDETEDALRALEERVRAEIPMLAQGGMPLGELVRVVAVEIGEENIVGVRCPTLVRIVPQRLENTYLATPIWVDGAITLALEAASLRVRVRVFAERTRRLERAYRRMTQRVNLFEKVLIPSTEEIIRRTRIVLADAERAAVVRSKIIKARKRCTREVRP